MKELVQREAVEVLHDEERDLVPILRAAARDDLNDVRVPNLREHLRLLKEAGDEAFVFDEVGVDGLRDVTKIDALIDDFVDGPHAALADHAHDL